MKKLNLTKTALFGAGGVLLLTILGILGIVSIGNNQSIANNAIIEANDSVVGQFITQTGQININLEIVDTPATREQGLMGRTKLATNSGMLFSFDGSQVRSFWMKDTLISLDIIFIDSNFIITDIAKSTKVNQTSETYSSTKAVKYVVELAGGATNLFGIKVGDRLQLSGR